MENITQWFDIAATYLHNNPIQWLVLLLVVVVWLTFDYIRLFKEGKSVFLAYLSACAGAFITLDVVEVAKIILGG